LVLFSDRRDVASFLRTAATFLSDLRAVSVTHQPDRDGDDGGGRPAEGKRAARGFERRQEAPVRSRPAATFG